MNSLTSARLMSMPKAGSARSRRSAVQTARPAAIVVRMTLRPYQLAVRMQRHQDAEARQQRDHGCAAVTDQGQRNTDDRKDEVGGALGQKLELRLTAVHVALAEQAARADGDLRLDDVIAGAQAVGLRMEKRQDALALIVVDEMPRTPGGGAEERNGDDNQANLQARQQHDDEAGGRNQQRSAQVR